MKRDKAYLVGIHRYSYKCGVPGEIIGVEFVTSEALNPQTRLCYHVRWADSHEDWIVASDNTFKIISFDDIIKGNIPDVTM